MELIDNLLYSRINVVHKSISYSHSTYLQDPLYTMLITYQENKMFIVKNLMFHVKQIKALTIE